MTDFLECPGCGERHEASTDDVGNWEICEECNAPIVYCPEMKEGFCVH